MNLKTVTVQASIFRVWIPDKIIYIQLWTPTFRQWLADTLTPPVVPQ